VSPDRGSRQDRSRDTSERSGGRTRPGYDFRNNTEDPAALDTDYFAVHCHANCASAAGWAGNETRLNPTSFDIRKAPYARGYFVGD
jgi:hypothetical protein